MNKRAARLLLWLLPACLLVSCTPETAMPSLGTPPQPMMLHVWLWPGSGLEPLLKSYGLKHPEVDIEVVTFQYDDVLPGLMTSLATKSDAPDLVLLESSQLNRMKRFQAYFNNLYDFGDERVHYLDWKWRMGESKDGGFLYAMPVDIGPVALAYRHDLFEAAGLPYEREAAARQLADWDALEKAGMVLKERTGAALFDNLSNVFLSYLYQFDGRYVTPDDRSLDPHVKEAWDRAVRFHRLGLNAGLPSQTSAWAEGAVNGKFAVVLAPSWLHGAIKKNAPATSGEWDLTRAPGLPSGWTGSYLAVPTTSRYPGAAYALAQWLTAPKQQLANFMDSGNFPSTPESYSTREFLEVKDPFFNGAPVGQIYSYAAVRYKTAYDDYEYAGIERMIRDGLRRVEAEGADPDKVWADIVRRYRELNQGG
ncbi:ABC transporter substrate-binding protein [Paenibacillus filicis]|uniref:ABC transporter substrate-binding protein n=1 Tax=Paenibacillus gyeongsangnamensis TaxID=3388067 RepID=A0ABT4QAU7_9BACL|nr:ABC transporter substrate-binding protein [Paenibacillus filicis]MCZ8514007.1 ABC transporter substrate-binding protein [Paenibacillus filicis]